MKLWKVSERDKRPEGYNLKDEEGRLRDPATITTLRVSPKAVLSASLAAGVRGAVKGGLAHAGCCCKLPLPKEMKQKPHYLSLWW